MNLTSNKIYEEMKILEDLVKTLNKFNVNYRIKGNILLHFIKYSSQYEEYFRGTKDLDIEVEYSSLDAIVRVFTSLEPDCIVEVAKNSKVKRISNLEWNNIVKIDISSKEFINMEDRYTDKYEINGVEFYGNSIEGIFKDKITSISTMSVSRRFKDIVDLFILFKLLNMTDIEIQNKLAEYAVGDFSQYFDKNTKKALYIFEGYYTTTDTLLENIYEYIGNIIKSLKEERSSLKWS